ncbi:MAG: hypothetical protein JWL81_1251 [Verrucomicrobiales bacterium]|nr:hypothetical protein [Verrucomicrobiales bacterium]
MTSLEKVVLGGLLSALLLGAITWTARHRGAPEFSHPSLKTSPTSP